MWAFFWYAKYPKFQRVWGGGAVPNYINISAVRNIKIGLNVREGVVHVRKAWFFEILIASCKFMQFAIFCK